MAASWFFDYSVITMMHGTINIRLTNFMQIRPVGAELFHADGRTGGRADRQAGRQTQT